MTELMRVCVSRNDECKWDVDDDAADAASASNDDDPPPAPLNNFNLFMLYHLIKVE